MNDTQKRVVSMIDEAAAGIIQAVENHLHSIFEDGEEATEETIKAQIDANIELTLHIENWNVQEALKAAVNEQISIPDLLEEYSH